MQRQKSARVSEEKLQLGLFCFFSAEIDSSWSTTPTSLTLRWCSWLSGTQRGRFRWVSVTFVPRQKQPTRKFQVGDLFVRSNMLRESTLHDFIFGPLSRCLRSTAKVSTRVSLADARDDNQRPAERWCSIRVDDVRRQHRKTNRASWRGVTDNVAKGQQNRQNIMQSSRKYF